MQKMEHIMGMPVVVEIADPNATENIFDQVFDYFRYVDATFSPFKPTSELNRINRGEISLDRSSSDMREVFDLSEKTKRETNGFFDIVTPTGSYNPSGLVKGWAIHRAADIIRQAGFTNFYVEAGGDLEVSGHNAAGTPWQIGIRNPFKPAEIIKIIELTSGGVATSGTYLRGQHIYIPGQSSAPITDITSITIIGPNIYEADRFATAAFAMQKAGINFIETQPNLEGYMIDKDGIATMTSGFTKYLPTHV